MRDYPSLLQAFQPPVPPVLRNPKRVCFQKLVRKKSPAPKEILALFPHLQSTSVYRLGKGKGAKKPLRIGVVFSGGPAPGGHNVIAALFDFGADLIGFKNGPAGLIKNDAISVTSVDTIRNQGGFDFLGTGRDKIEKKEDFFAALKTIEAQKLDGVVIIGGDDSNTNAAFLAEFLKEQSCKASIIGVPKTIDGDLRGECLEMSFGFDTATKVYSEMIGNLAKDALSSKKYYHFIRLMGRNASHVALECALKVQPNLTLISEEKKPLGKIVEEIADLVIERKKRKKSYGVILIPEGLLEHAPGLMDELPSDALTRDSHGNIELSKIETEKILLRLVKKRLKEQGFSEEFSAITHFFGYEGRSSHPSRFDASYTYSLGLAAAIAIRDGLSGLIVSIQNLKKSVDHWQVSLLPIIDLMGFEERKGKRKPVVKKFLVDLKTDAFIKLSVKKPKWGLEDHYRSVGPLQFFGPKDWFDQPPLTL